MLVGDDTIDRNVYRGQLTNSLGLALRSGKHGLDVIPGLVRKALEQEAWKEHVVIETGGRCPGFASFEEYVYATPPEGLGATMDLIERIVAGDRETELLLDKFRRRPVSRPAEINHKIMNYEAQTLDTSTGYVLSRLESERPDLLARVKANELTPGAAGAEAGFYPRRIAVNLADPQSAAATLRKHGSPEFLAELRRLLNDGGSISS